MIRETFLAVASGPGTQVPKQGVEDVARLFGEYLYLAGGSRGRSKHGSLGAVGKVLRRARTVRGTALLGHARRIHEQLTQNTFAAGPAEKLDEGIRSLEALLGSHPSMVSVILEHVDYATYFDVKRRFVDFQRGWKRFVFQNQKALGLTVANEDAAPWLSKKLAERKDGDWIAAREKYLATLRDRPADDDTNEED
jgi:hypothetical protein